MENYFIVMKAAGDADYSIVGPFTSEGRAYTRMHELEERGEHPLEVFQSRYQRPDEALREFIEQKGFQMSDGLNLQEYV